MNVFVGQRRLGVAIVGLGGAVATTAIAGIELLRLGVIDAAGLPLADVDPQLVHDLVRYEDLVFRGWDLNMDNLYQAAQTHNVLTPVQLQQAGEELAGIEPWPAVGNAEFCRNVVGQNLIAAPNHRAAIRIMQSNLAQFRHEGELDSVVVVNLASTERSTDTSLPLFATIDAFEAALDANAPEIGPALLYAYAAIGAGVPYVNFTPSVAADVPALIALAKQNNVPITGKDGKTGQTMMKTVIAPALRSRALRVDGWFSTNILGNRDGEVLDDPESFKTKEESKLSVLEHILQPEVYPDLYEGFSHVVRINYYPPRGDAKEGWDNIDLFGWLGYPMQIKIDFLCRDSILAAPIVLDLALLMDLAHRAGFAGTQEWLSFYFKSPMTAPSLYPEHDLFIQSMKLKNTMRWMMGEDLITHLGNEYYD